MVKCEDCINKRIFNKDKNQYYCEGARPFKCVNIYKLRTCMYYRKKKSFADWLFRR